MNKDMKWFFAISENSLMRPSYNWPDLIRTAVVSARENTKLIPHLLYDGEENAFIRDLRFLGVTILQHRVSFYQTLMAVHPENKDYLETASGAFLRVDIPAIVKADDYVVYTDCDVVFLKDPCFEEHRPTWFSAASQMIKNDYDDMNSGVMLINVAQMRSSYIDFVNFIKQNVLRLSKIGHDQPCLREFYKGKYDLLPMEFNWKPYWGYNEAAKILHFHGPKPVQVEFLAQDVNYPCDAVIRKLYSTDPRSYSEYIADWTKYRKLGERIIGLAPRDAQGAPVTVLPLEFDADSYLLANKDLAVAKVDPLAHYLRHGFREGRRLRE